MARLGLLPMGGTGRRRGVEWPSVALCGGVYGGFLALTWFAAGLPPLLTVVLGAGVLALHASMQHEFIHGHPTGWRRLNHLLGSVPLSLWLPFESYRLTHLVHHKDESLTDPYDDPETYYWTHDNWSALGRFGRTFLRVHSTLAGRLTIGPAWTVGRYLVGEAKAVWRDAPRTRGIWVRHGIGVTAVLGWVWGVCGIDPIFYVFGMVYPAVAILLLRSFAEHRAEMVAAERTAIVENAPIFGFLFLYNNLHAAHHERPAIPWYALPGWYRANRDRLVAANGGLVYEGYGDVMRRYLLVPHHVTIHPFQAGTLDVARIRHDQRARLSISGRIAAKRASIAARFMS